VVGGRSSRVRRDGRPAISNAIAIAVAIIIVLAGLASFAYMGNVSTEYLGKALPEKLRQEGERGSELLRIYIWSRNHTLEGEPVITILNAWGKDSEIDVLMVANRTGHVVRVLALGPPMKIPASTAVEIRPSDLGLPYRTFGDLIQNIGGILAHTVLGNSFGSTWGMPREEYVFGSIATTAITNVTTTAWVVTGFTSVQEETTINLYTTLSYPPEWGGNALIIAYDHLGTPPNCQGRYPTPWREGYKEFEAVGGEEKPKISSHFCDICGPGAESVPRFTWYLVRSPYRIIRIFGEYRWICSSPNVFCGWDPYWECRETWVLRNVTISAVEPTPLGYRTVYQISGSGQAVEKWEWFGGKFTFFTYQSPAGYVTKVWPGQPTLVCDPQWNAYTTSYLATGPILQAFVSTTTYCPYSDPAVCYNMPWERRTVTTTSYYTAMQSLQPITVTGTTTTTVTVTLNRPLETVTHTVTGVKPATATLFYEDKNRVYTYTITAYGTYWNPWTRVCVTSTYGRYAAVIYGTPTYTFTTTTTHTTVPPNFATVTNPYSPYNAEYEGYEAGNKPGIYGQNVHLYFKVVYPVYIIHRYYEKVDCDCKTYSSPSTGGEGPKLPSTPIRIPKCDVRVERVNGEMRTVVIYCFTEVKTQ